MTTRVEYRVSFRVQCDTCGAEHTRGFLVFEPDTAIGQALTDGWARMAWRDADGSVLLRDMCPTCFEREATP